MTKRVTIVLCAGAVLAGCASEEKLFQERRAQLTPEERVAVDACVDEGLKPGNMEFVNCAIREYCLRKQLPAGTPEHRQCFDERKDLYLVRYFSRELDVRLP